MPAEIVMPQLGLTMTEGSVTAWLKQLGDPVQKGEALFTVETDKVEMEVESTASGTLASILVGIGEKVNVGTVIAKVAAAGEVVAEDHDGKPEFVASPRARKVAKELGVDLAQVKPARGLRITEDDVRRFQSISFPAVAAGRPSTPRRDTVRQAIAERVSASFARAPHFYLGVEVNAAGLERAREEVSEAIEQRAGIKLTYTDFFLMSIAKSLAEHAGVNAVWRDGVVIRNSSVHVGFAVQGPEALLVPVIRDADRLSLAELASARHGLAGKARAGALTLAETENGSATLSNLGPYGIDWFQAILNPPQSVMVSTGRIAKRPVVIGDRIEIRPMLTVTLSADHRVVDGVAAAQFLGRIRELLEDPGALRL